MKRDSATWEKIPPTPYRAAWVGLQIGAVCGLLFDGAIHATFSVEKAFVNPHSPVSLPLSLDLGLVGGLAVLCASIAFFANLHPQYVQRRSGGT